jgi:excisionase family DNA binding protein
MSLAAAPDVLTVAEAAMLMRVGRNQMYQAIDRGEIRAGRIGRSLRVPKASLERWLLFEPGESDLDSTGARVR